MVIIIDGEKGVDAGKGGIGMGQEFIGKEHTGQAFVASNLKNGMGRGHIHHVTQLGTDGRFGKPGMCMEIHIHTNQETYLSGGDPHF